MCLEAYKDNPKVRFNSDNLEEAMPSYVCRPYYTVRGKAITPEQAKQIIIAEEPLFKGWNDNTLTKQNKDYHRDTRGILRNLFYKSRYLWLNTWLFTDGAIGMNSLTLGKYPEVDEFIPQWIGLGFKYPFLDMLVSITSYDKSPCDFCSLRYKELLGNDKEDKDAYYECNGIYKEKCKEALSKLKGYYKFTGSTKEEWEEYLKSLRYIYFDINEPDNFYDSVKVAIWLHNGEIDIYTDEEASKKSKEYEDNYNKSSNHLSQLELMSEYYDFKVNCICNKEYIIDCFNTLGLNGEEYYNYSIKKDYITDISNTLFTVHGVQTPSN